MDAHNRMEVSISALADRTDDMLGEIRRIRDRLTLMENALILAGAALRSHNDPETKIADAIGHMRIADPMPVQARRSARR